MPYLILARHGNTFEADQTPTWVGAVTDLPLTERGEQQGRALTEMIAREYSPVGAILTGPLLRTTRFAEILGERINLPYSIDDRLCEINYGLWENITTEETRARYGDALVDAWENEGLWPKNMEWEPSKDTLLQNIQSLLEQQYNALKTDNKNNRILFTSNGILRFIYTYLTGKPPSPEAKVKPGNYCALEPVEEGWKIIKWNEKPS